jgi:hypothetical protein
MSFFFAAENAGLGAEKCLLLGYISLKIIELARSDNGKTEEGPREEGEEEGRGNAYPRLQGPIFRQKRIVPQLEEILLLAYRKQFQRKGGAGEWPEWVD